MGTRHLIGVWQNNAWKVAQYGQWDGYPTGQGHDILEFLKSTDLGEFAKKVEQLSFLTPDDFKALEAANAQIADYPELSRDTSAKLLQMIMDRGPLKLKDSHEFAGDSLFCEWAYVIDLDAGTFEVYKGFVETSHTGERFSDYEQDSKYYPVKLLKTYRLDDLPNDISKLGNDEDDDEDEETVEEPAAATAPSSAIGREEIIDFLSEWFDRVGFEDTGEETVRLAPHRLPEISHFDLADAILAFIKPSPVWRDLDAHLVLTTSAELLANNPDRPGPSPFHDHQVMATRLRKLAEAIKEN